MPIRTNRGRAAVYRRLWGWPLRSPNHLVIAIVVFAGVVFALGIIVPNAVSGSKGARQGATGTGVSSPAGQGQVGVLPTTSASTPLPTKAQSPTAAPPSAAPDVNAQLVADAWALAWVNHPKGITTDKWVDGLKELTTDELLPNLRSVDPANVPDELKGPVKLVESHPNSAKYEVDLENGKLVMTVVKRPEPEGWRVHEYTRVG